MKEYRNKWANKEGVNRNVLGEWEGTVLSLLKGKTER